MQGLIDEGKTPDELELWTSSETTDSTQTSINEQFTNVMTPWEIELGWLRQESRFLVKDTVRQVKWDFVFEHSTGRLRELFIEEQAKSRWKDAKANRVKFLLSDKKRPSFDELSDKIHSAMLTGYRRPHMMPYVDLSKEAARARHFSPNVNAGSPRPAIKKKMLARAKNLPKEIHQVGDEVMACQTQAVDDDHWFRAKITGVHVAIENRFEVRYYSMVFFHNQSEQGAVHEAFVKTPEDYEWLDAHSEDELKGITRCSDPKARDKYNRLRGWYETELTERQPFNSVCAAMRAFDDEFVALHGASVEPKNLNLPEEWNFDPSKGAPTRKVPLAKAPRSTERVTKPSEDDLSRKRGKDDLSPLDEEETDSENRVTKKRRATPSDDEYEPDEELDAVLAEDDHELITLDIRIENKGREVASLENGDDAGQPDREEPPETKETSRKIGKVDIANEDSNENVDGEVEPPAKRKRVGEFSEPASLRRLETRTGSDPAVPKGHDAYVQSLEAFESRGNERWEDFQRRILKEREEFGGLGTEEQRQGLSGFLDMQRARWDGFVSEEQALLNWNILRCEVMIHSLSPKYKLLVERHVSRRRERLEDCCRRLQQDAISFLSQVKDVPLEEWQDFFESQEERWRHFKHSEGALMQLHIQQCNAKTSE
eukprot:CAMPEP_0116835288 /NCGR_PEP_ID=MMETSP0418-20121206/7465_1 /TAXON_ID=1158023 /ORGANISM="Astrosyne radiata, Strain 13vi08-1A" /LENGTH=655 /DNA_ID=CAMNT_0004464945 /DNA_START=264 /DNA_END=2231 /DNA_ORIENTATION=-